MSALNQAWPQYRFVIIFVTHEGYHLIAANYIYSDRTLAALQQDLSRDVSNGRGTENCNDKCLEKVFDKTSKEVLALICSGR